MAIRNWFSLSMCAVAAVGLLVSVGCGPSQNQEPSQPTTVEDGRDHGDDHNHADEDDHEHGPNGGALVKLNDKLVAEWTVDAKDNLVKVYILDAESKEEVPIAGSQVTISATVAGQTQTYDLPAVSADAPMASQFALTDAPFELIGALESEDEDQVQLQMTVPVGEEPVTVKFEPHHH